MSRERNQIVRQWILLRKLEGTRWYSVTQLHEYLRDSEDIDCARKTVERDLVQLSDAGFRIEESKSQWRLSGGAAGERNIGASEPEMVALVVAQRHLANSPMAAPLGGLFAKVRATLSPKMRAYADALEDRYRATISGFVPDDAVDPTILQGITRAANASLLTRISYLSPSSGESERLFEPYLLWEARGSLYVVGHDRKSGQSRTFAIHRIVAAEVLSETFEPDPTFDASRFTQSGFGVIDGEPYRVQVEFRADMAYIINERAWHPTQR